MALGAVLARLVGCVADGGHWRIDATIERLDQLEGAEREEADRGNCQQWLPIPGPLQGA